MTYSHARSSQAQRIAVGSMLGVSVIFGLWWAVQSLRASMGIELAVAGSVWTQAAVLVVVADFIDYFRHRHEHESSGLFWRVRSDYPSKEP